MDRMLYIAMTGAKQALAAQQVNTHNLANANTTGFKADLASFVSVPVTGGGYASRVYGMAVSPGTDLSPGTLDTTGRDLDVGIVGDGWFAVQAPDGKEAYSRDGSLRIGTGGLLTNGAGRPVLGENGPIVIPAAEKITIGTDGTLSIVAVGQPSTTLAVLDRLKLVKPDRALLTKGEDGLMHLAKGGKAAADAGVVVSSGSLESSNVNPVDALITMITLARQFQFQMKTITTAEENDNQTTQLMRLG